jgi:hypothetical protein
MLVGVQLVEQREDPVSRVKQEPKFQETALKVCIDFYRAKLNCRRQEGYRCSHVACASWVNRGNCEYKGNSC